MFEAIELGHKLAKEKYDLQLPKLRDELLQYHLKLKAQKFPVIIIIAGGEGVGKGELVQRLNEWLEPHGVETHAFMESTKEKHDHPEFWRYWKDMPGDGRIAILFGSWYGEPLLRRVFHKSKGKDFEKALNRITALEKLLTDDGAVILKFWLHLTKEDQAKALAKLKDKDQTLPDEWKNHKHYDRFRKVAEQAISRTDLENAPWNLIDASDKRYREFTVGTILLNALKQRIDSQAPAAPQRPASIEIAEHIAGVERVNVLDRVDLKQKLTDKQYEAALDVHQTKLHALSWKAHQQNKSMILMFEGWDAAGKGSAIRRVIHAIDARLYKVRGIAAPTDEERAQPYLWRFWRHLPPAGYTTVFDRSWYGRVLVERVEGFATVPEWSRAYREINDFEEQLTDYGIVLMKFWIHISPEEQLARFKEREKVPYKQYKITEEDWRNRDKWDKYKDAVNDMVTRCSTQNAPWTLVAGNDKKFARIQILKTITERLEKAV